MLKKLGFGLMRLPLIDFEDTTSIDIPKVVRMADRFLAEGFSYFDTAHPYHRGNSEPAFREAVVKRHSRGSYTIADKLSFSMIRDKEEIPGFFEKQLNLLGVDHIDYYLLHALSEKSFRQAESMDAFGFVARMKKEGKLGSIGMSFHDKPELLDEILTKHPEMEFVQLQINYIDWLDEGVQAGKCHDVALKHGKPIIVMEPVKGGRLADLPAEAAAILKAANPCASLASWAVRYAAGLDSVIMVLSGMSDESHIEDNIGYMRDFKPLDEQEKKALDKAASIVRSRTAIDCTDCRYCVEHCPQKIAIPDYFEIFNDLNRYGEGRLKESVSFYRRIAQTKGKASDCIKCAFCEEHCPQHLEIRKHLEEVSLALETIE